MTTVQADFKHFVYLASGVLIVKLDGALNRQCKSELENLYGEIQKLDFENLVLNLQKVKQVDQKSYRFLVQVQLLIRNRDDGKVRILPPQSPIKEKLAFEGIIKNEEVYSNLKAALESI